MKRKITKYMVIVLAILLAELLHAFAHSFLEEFLTDGAPYRSVAILMVTAVVVFYPAFHFIQKYLKYTSEKYVQGAQKVTKNRFIGLMIGFALAIFLLFAAFSQVWYHKNPMNEVRTRVDRIF
jgi:hypothetical protein